MTPVDQDLVNELARHDSSLTLSGLVRYLERHHPVEGPGVPRDLVEAYADELDYDPERVATAFEDRLTDARSWQPGDRLYRIDDNVSIHPPTWHERLADTTDLAEYVAVMLESVRAPDGVEIDEQRLGIVQSELVTAIEIIAEIDRDDAHQLLREQRNALSSSRRSSTSRRSSGFPARPAIDPLRRSHVGCSAENPLMNQKWLAHRGN
jgi:hypothetical protein